MKRSQPAQWLFFAALIFVAVVAAPLAARADHGSRIVVSGRAGVHVWVDGGGDVYPDYDDVTIWLRAERDCYATLFLVDTDGYLHVLFPSSPYDDAWVDGGMTYHYSGYDLGLEYLDGAGIAYVFAVGSPVPFDYSCFGDDIFVGGFGYRVYGDPFVACRDFYVSVLPGWRRWDCVGVGYARFYVRRWVRYPSYLCLGGPGVHVRVGHTCGVCEPVYASYRWHTTHPHDAFRTTAPRFKERYTYGSDDAGQAYRASIKAVHKIGRAERGAMDRAPAVHAKTAMRARTAERAVDRAPAVRTKTLVREKTAVHAKSLETIKGEARGDAVRRPVSVVSRKAEKARGQVRVVSSSRTAGPARVIAPAQRVVERRGAKGVEVAKVERGRAASRAQEKGAGKKIRRAK